MNLGNVAKKTTATYIKVKNFIITLFVSLLLFCVGFFLSRRKVYPKTTATVLSSSCNKTQKLVKSNNSKSYNTVYDCDLVLHYPIDLMYELYKNTNPKEDSNNIFIEPPVNGIVTRNFFISNPVAISQGEIINIQYDPINYTPKSVDPFNIRYVGFGCMTISVLIIIASILNLTYQPDNIVISNELYKHRRRFKSGPSLFSIKL